MTNRMPLNIMDVLYAATTLVTPIGVVADASGNRIAVTNYGNNTVLILDATIFSVLATVTGFSSPATVGFDAVNNKFYVGNDGTTAISIIDGTSYSVTHNVIVSAPNLISPRAIKFDNSGDRFFVSAYGSNKINVYKISDNSVVTSFASTTPIGMVLDGANNKIYVSNNSLNVLNTYNFTTYASGSNISGSGYAALVSPYGLCQDPDNSNYIIIVSNGANKLCVLDKSSGTITKVFNGLTMARNACVINSKIYTTCSSINKISIIEKFYL